MSGGQITYDAAIGSLRSMFPGMDVAVIEMILEANRTYTRTRERVSRPSSVARAGD
jgi:hypothetical protein